MELIRTFNKVNKNDAPIAGGKGASLGEMTQAGIPVPPGFVILADTFEKFLEETDLNVEIAAELGKVDHREMHTIEHASETIQALILNVQTPESIETKIKNAFKELNTEFVAVRSSATAEDGAEAAWAGQLDTFLNTTEESLLENVQRCWASLFTPRAIFYRFEKGLHTQKISVAVVVQKMVNSDKAGIAFSVHPVTEDRNQMIIEAGWGLGEAVVSGQVTPDSYVVTKEPREILDINVNEQAQGLYRKEGGGNEWISIPTEKGKSQVLTNEQILNLADTLVRIESHYGFPVDTEWAMEGNELYIVQSRPITTLQQVSSSETSLVKTFFKEIKEDKLTLIEADFIPMFIVIDWLNYYDRDDSVKDIYPFFYFKNGISSKVYLNLTKYHNVAKMIFGRYLDKHLDLEEWMRRYEKVKGNIDRSYDSYLNDAHSNEKELLEQLSQADAELREIVALTLFLDMFDRSNIQEVLEEKNWDVDLSKIWKISEIQDFSSFDIQNKEQILDAIENKNIDSLQYVFANYTSVPSIENIQENIKGYNLSDLKEEIAQAKQKIDENKKLKEQERQSLTPEEQTVLTFIDWASALRDHRKTLMNKCDVLLFNLTSDLYKLWQLDASFVPVSFVFDTLKGREHVTALSEVISKRKDKMALIYYGKDKYVEDIDFNISNIDELSTHYLEQNKPKEEGLIKGDTACRGLVRGTAKIITTQSEFGKLQEGDILVTGMTRPEFVPLMKLASAIVTDEGGITSHAAIVSRELNKPCVIGTKIGTQILKDGMEIEVDANNGIVRILKSQISFEKIYTRDTTILMQEAWGIACSQGVERFFKKNEHSPGIIHFMNEGSIEIWENKEATQWLMDAILVKNSANSTFTQEIAKTYKSRLAEIQSYWNKEYLENINELSVYFSKVMEAVTNFVVYYYSAVDERTPKQLRDEMLKLRDEDTFFATSDAFIRATLLHHYPEIEGYETTILIEEVGNIPPMDELKRRRQHMTLIDGKERNTESLEELHIRHPEYIFENQVIENTSNSELKGQTAQPGIVQGRVRILRRRNQIKEVLEGEIIVSPMTTPDFLPAMQKAAAFVTDEGGITCHAGIVARELKKPCIIGTKFATQILKDGDLVEVDATNGIVRIKK